MVGQPLHYQCQRQSGDFKHSVFFKRVFIIIRHLYPKPNQPFSGTGTQAWARDLLLVMVSIWMFFCNFAA